MSPASARRSDTQTKYQELPGTADNGNEFKAEGALDDVREADGDEVTGRRCRCGLGRLAHPNVFVLLIGLMYLGVYGSSGVYLSGVISTVEKRFQLKSSESGLLMIMNDISGLCGVLFISHFAGKFHRPRVLGVSGLIVALGTFMTALPQFLFDNRALESVLASGGQSPNGTARFSFSEELVCRAEANETACTAEEVEASGSQLPTTWPLILGQLLCGVGSTALTPLAVTYVDDAVKKTLLPVYLALMWLPMTVAPLIGYSLSNFCLSFFTDFYKTDVMSRLTISPQDPQWQGAWWLGFLFYGCYLCLVSLPFFLLPRRMRPPASYFCVGAGCSAVRSCTELVSRRRAGGDGDEGKLAMAGLVSQDEHTLSLEPLAAIKEFLASLWRLLSNAIFMTASAGFISWVLSFSGFLSFAPKYIQFQFDTSPGEAGLYLGLVNMPGTLIGLFLGGTLTSQLTGNRRGYGVLSVVNHSLAVLVLVAMLFLGCPNVDIAGITAPYGPNTSTANGLDVYSACNANCSCAKGVFSPVCGPDNVTYVTPCLAGCAGLGLDADNGTVFQDCSCIEPPDSLEGSASGSAVQGACAAPCDLLLPYLVLIGVTAAVGSVSYNPSFMMQFRSVLDEDRHLALGFNSFVAKVLGFIPAPVLFGAIIESKCAYWQESCQETGECMLYDRPGLRQVYVGATLSFRLLALLFFALSLFFIFKSTASWAQPTMGVEATETGRDETSLEQPTNATKSGKETSV